MLQLLSFSAQGLSELAAPLSGSVHCVSSVLLRRFLPSCFNKLPYVSICSTTEESELTFQSAGPCALWIHRPRISTSTSFITLNDWLTDWRPSVITPERPPCCFLCFHPLLLSSPPRLDQQTQVWLLLRLRICSASFCKKCRELGLFNPRNNRQGSPAGGVNRLLCWMP